MLKRKIKKVSGTLKQLFKSGKNTKKFILCKVCELEAVEVAHDIVAVTCAYCVQRQVPPPDNIKPKEAGEKFPRGWALKATYIHTDGRIFEKGKDTGKKYIPTNPKTEIALKEKKTVSKKKTAKKVIKKKTTKRRK
jgi:hypothetical protein